MPELAVFNMANMSFKIIHKIKILAKFSKFTEYKTYTTNLKNICPINGLFMFFYISGKQKYF